MNQLECWGKTMYWKLEALTATKTFITKVVEGTYEEVVSDAALYDLEIISVSPDYLSILKNLFRVRKLSSGVLSIFFNDFAAMQKSGMSLNESFTALSDSTSNELLKDAIKKMETYVIDGRSLQEAFEYTKIFPKMVITTISVAEKSGAIVELSKVLAEYYKYSSETKKKMIGSLLYPCGILLSLTVFSIYICMNLIPKLAPLFQHANASTSFLINYANFVKNYWWLIVLGILGLGAFIKYAWDNNRDNLMELVFKIPLFGNLYKSMELSNLFLNFYVYIKSGLNVVETLSHLHQAHNTYVTEKLLTIKQRILNGSSLTDAFKADKFFPSLIVQNLLKGEKTGNLGNNLKTIYDYYDTRSKEMMELFLKIIEPSLMVLSASFLIIVWSGSIGAIYTNVNHLGAGVFK